MLLHSDKLSLFQANQSLPLLINVVCLEATNTNFIDFGLTQLEKETKTDKKQEVFKCCLGDLTSLRINP